MYIEFDQETRMVDQENIMNIIFDKIYNIW